ncbi:MAG: hypothetical protein A3G87_00395 [Omnitrophica bacterium RIFCSPLOWO2_12_FULL_50_11]|nr:MAG: hypothetical protein A3G87_00395 [Omnitrophica bacterium RIFCSPLOWO2_12_FULL_50_11]
MKYPNVLELLAEAFGKAKIPFVLVGGFAVNYYKATRGTADLDVLILEKNYDTARAALEGAGYREERKNPLFARFREPKARLMEIDLIFVDPNTFEGIIEDAGDAKISGHRFKIPSLDHLFALKLHSIKNNPNEREYRDLYDILELIKRNRIAFRSKKFRDLCLKYGSAAIYKKILEALKNWKR